MHICFLSPEYPHKLSKPSGGLGTSIKNLAEGLVGKGERISVIVYGQKEDKSFSENGIQFYFLKQRYYKVGGWWFYRKYLQRFLNNLIKTERVDLVEAPDWTGISAFINLKCPLLIRLNGSDAYFCHLEGRPQKIKNRFLEKRALQKADALASVSAFTADKTNEIFSLNRKFTVIPNSLKTENFKPAPVEVIPDRILYFGSIIRKKGVLELAGIFNKVVDQRPDAKLNFIGKDVVDIFEHRSTVEMIQERLSTSAEKNVKFISEVPYEEVQQHIGEAQVVVLPSFAEALPMTWLEAMAMEKALVTSNIGWAHEVMLNGETGYTESPRDHEAYAGKIIKLLDDKLLAQEMGKNARKRVVEQFSSELIAQSNLEFYRKQIKK